MFSTLVILIETHSYKVMENCFHFHLIHEMNFQIEILLLTVLLAYCPCSCGKYQVLKDKDVAQSFRMTNSISSAKIKSKFLCLKECEKDSRCVTVTYDTSKNECTLLNGFVLDIVSDTYAFENSYIFYKTANSTTTSQATTTGTASATSTVTSTTISQATSTGTTSATSTVTSTTTTTSRITTLAPLSYITGDALTSFGVWGIEETCVNRDTAIGYQLQVDAASDNTALNSIKLFCNQTGAVTSSMGASGTWKTAQYCPTTRFLVGFKLRSQAYQGIFTDDTAANDLQMLCSDDTLLTASGGAIAGTWGVMKNCSTGFICGIQTLVEPFVLVNDNTALNNVKFTCCP
jgi:Vitelline membrane outer layer protein I (VOMI)